jgi:hypothetical protein
VRIHPLYFGSRWQARADAHQRFPLRIGALAMQVLRRNWLVSNHIEQRFANYAMTLRLAIEGRNREPAPAAAAASAPGTRTVIERSRFGREHFRTLIFSELLRTFHEYSQVRIERQNAAATAVLRRAAESRGPQSQPPAPVRVVTRLVPAMATAALARVERIERLLYEPLRRELVARPAPPAVVRPAAEPPAPEFARSRTAFAATPLTAQELPANIDIERLTDRLMRNIDRRLTASRERNGRI